MNFFNGKARTICMCNVIVPFVCTGFLGVKTNNGIILGSTTDEAHEISLTASDTEPVSQYGEGEENKFAFIFDGIETIINQQDFTGPLPIDGEENDFAFITKGVGALIEQHENVLAKEEKKAETKKTTKKTTTKKSTTKKSTSSSSKKTTTSVVKKKEVASSKTYKKTSSSSLTGDAIVSFAKQFMGLRYKTGTPSLTKGSDCSGFTMLIYKEFGVSLPRTVGGQMSRGTKVSKSNLQKGDLVFYKNKGAKGGATHVTIYIGGGKVIHESRPGVGVKISTVNMMQYVTARRVINSKATKIAEQKVAAQKQAETKTDTTVNTQTTATTTPSINNEEKNEIVNNNVASSPSPSTAPSTTTTPATTVPTVETKQEVVADTPKVETKVEEPKKEESKKEEVSETPVSNPESN